MYVIKFSPERLYIPTNRKDLMTVQIKSTNTGEIIIIQQCGT